MTPPLPNTGSTEETTIPRRPFNFRQEVGDGFLIGSVLGSLYHVPKGGFQAIYTKVPRVAGYWAVYWGAYEAIEYAMVSTRRKEEPVLNFVVGGTGASGIAAMSKGVRAASGYALATGAFAAALCAGKHMFKEYRRRKLSLEQADDTAQAACPTRTRS